MKVISKATERSVPEMVQKLSYFNCGTSYRWVTITISKKTICEACIIHNENEINLVFDWSS